MYRSVTESKQPRDDKRSVLYRVEGIMIGIVIVLGMVYAIGWLRF